ncbi:PQQ-dependent sugar dehydrogenase [Neiella marina]|uniref:PQQ-dependent sugar dehydrogenase n=1 Tax=Neiella holothuriorum TaxID=2870530 RepID=A0ABS7EHJ9_9GAMM|nr:PQQ-dependent sugar dehydrogenase [Neiella holothuriorum]MBW8191800.1 PQQ-dependent sugar dehydrogenase [Neiella holothuriorum]
MNALFISTLLIVLSTLISTQANARTAAGVYRDYCADCHGRNLEGGLGPSLTDSVWLYDNTDQGIEKIIRDGSIENGMPPFAATLDDKAIRSLVIHIREKASQANNDESVGAVEQGLVQTKHHAFELVELAKFSGITWAMAQLPDGSFLVTIRDKQLWHLQPDGSATEIKGLPDIWQRGQGGLLDVALHPEFEKTGWVYLTYSESQDLFSGMTTLVRGKIEQGKWQQQQILFSGDSDDSSSAGVHFGSRIIFKDNHLYFTIGDRGRKEQAQSLDHPNGKVHRLTLDGATPADNPYPDAKYPSIWSYGHRNPQGITLNPATGDIWSVEHGPRGGDELNLIKKGLNYGWPEITHGMNYSGTPMTANTAKAGMEQPEVFWVPSLAVSAVHFYQGNQFPQWRGHLLVASLRAEQLVLLELKDSKVQSQEVLLRNQDRIRDVIEGRDGSIYLALEDRGTNSSRIVRLEPVETPAQ